MKGLVLGPIHKNEKDEINGTDLRQIDSTLGSQEDFKDLLQSAKKKSGFSQGSRRVWHSGREAGQEFFFLILFTPDWFRVFLGQAQERCVTIHTKQSASCVLFLGDFCLSIFVLVLR